MDEFQIRNKICEIRSYVSSKWCCPEQAKILYAERERLEKMLEDLKNDPQKNAETEREKN